MAALKDPARYKTVYDALAFITKTQFLLGYTGFYKKDSRFVATRQMLAYSLALPLLVGVCLTLATYLRVVNPEYSKTIHKLDKLIISIIVLEIFMAVVSFSINVTSMQLNRYRHIALMDHIDRLDARLVAEFDVRMCYEKIAFKTFTIVVVYFVYATFIALTLAYQSGIYDIASLVGIICSYSFIIGGMQMSTYGFMNIADVVRIRFRLLQKLLAPDYLRRHFVDGDMRASKLRGAIEIYRGLYEVIDELNCVYGLCLLSSMAHDFILVTIQLYLMFGRSSNLSSDSNLKVFLGVFASVVLPAYKMVMMPIYSTMSIEEGKKCMRAIKLMDDAFPGDGRVRQIVGATLHWNNHNKVEYRIGHTITSNRGMMAAVITAVVNYVAIMIQFQIQEEVLTKDKEKRGAL